MPQHIDTHVRKLVLELVSCAGIEASRAIHSSTVAQWLGVQPAHSWTPLADQHEPSEDSTAFWSLVGPGGRHYDVYVGGDFVEVYTDGLRVALSGNMEPECTVDALGRLCWIDGTLATEADVRAHAASEGENAEDLLDIVRSIARRNGAVLS